jgi:rhodanese-related sulfurtransferase
MKELEKTKRISISAVLFLLVIVIALLTYKRPKFNFVTSAEKTLEAIIDQHQLLSMTDFKAMEASSYLLVDVRNNFEFSKGHINGAVNIATSQFLENESIDLIANTLDNGKSVILYGETPDEANNAWILLYQLGYSNMNVLSINTAYDRDNFSVKSVEVEKPALNYAVTMQKAKVRPVKTVKVMVNPVPEPKKKVVTKPKKKKAPEGGC